MIVGAVAEMFGFFFKIIVVLAALVIGAIFFIGWNYNSNDNEYRSKRKIEPETIIDIQIVNGVQTSDTTYVYNFKQ